MRCPFQSFKGSCLEKVRPINCIQGLKNNQNQQSETNELRVIRNLTKTDSVKRSVENSQSIDRKFVNLHATSSTNSSHHLPSLSVVTRDADTFKPVIPQLDFSIELPNISQLNEIPTFQHFVKKQFNSGKRRKKLAHLNITDLLINITLQQQQIEASCKHQPQNLNQKQIVANFVNQKFKNKKINRVKEQEKLIGIAKLQVEATAFFDRILKDRTLCPLFKDVQDKENLKNIHKHVLGITFGNQFEVSAETLQDKHKHLKIKNAHFYQMKFHYILSMLEMGTPVEMIYKVAQQIESYRYPIQGKLPIFQQFGGLTGVNAAATLMYSKIFSDYILGIFFQGIDLDTQAYKFARLFSQLLNTNDSPNYSLEVLRERHVKYGLTYVHYAYFKMYLSQALNELNVPLKKLSCVLSILDGYKCAVLNVESVYDLILKNLGSLDEFIKQFVSLCKQDSTLNSLIFKRTPDRFTKHAKNMFYYMFNRQMSALTFRDLILVHRNKPSVTLEVFEIIEKQAIYLVEQLKPSSIVLRDFSEEFEELKCVIMNDRLPFEAAGGWNKIYEFGEKLAHNIAQQPLLMRVFNDYEMNPLSKIKRTLEFLCCGNRYYKKTDIQTIHSRLRISNEMFSIFENTIECTINNYDPSLKWIMNFISLYKPYIINESKQ